ncbi:hypothetical protein [Ornithinimicrobium sp. INDO-MA30-4]|uniref:hypothetical protein n=1 Tax=Ornithinimicrobium sp. INDO-MA30-4 TaxID=2908651 RepID=UPI0028833F70|nr:hypothetical protein [Ornithinimicrobium sp. INDO-MA30-4]
MAPVIDVVLLAAVVVDLSRGSTASWPHGLAAVYIGLSVAYGHRMIGWADVRFAHLMGRGSAPVKPTGHDYTLHCWADVARTLLAGAIAAGIIVGIGWWIDDPSRTRALSDWLPILGIIVAIDVLWAVSYTVWPRKA